MVMVSAASEEQADSTDLSRAVAVRRSAGNPALRAPIISGLAAVPARLCLCVCCLLTAQVGPMVRSSETLSACGSQAGRPHRAPPVFHTQACPTTRWRSSALRSLARKAT